MCSSEIKEGKAADLCGKRILVVFAHPDDVDSHFGGTVATMSAAGAEITYLCATQGDKGDRIGKRPIEKYQLAEFSPPMNLA